MRRRLLTLMAAIAAIIIFSPATANAATVSRLVHHAHGNPFKCNIGAKSWSMNENKCVVRVVYKREPSIGRVATRIVGCETGHTWDEFEVNPDSGASGLAQFLRSTWRNLPRRFSRHSVFHPVWNIRGMRYLRMHDGNFHQWVCQ